jgi:hypothetical protein
LFNVSYGSLMEIVRQIEIAFELGYQKKDAFENISKKAKKLSFSEGSTSGDINSLTDIRQTRL